MTFKVWYNRVSDIQYIDEHSHPLFSMVTFGKGVFEMGFNLTRKEMKYFYSPHEGKLTLNAAMLILAKITKTEYNVVSHVH